jgi:poly-beta-1,6-N-acetyl-D-glucosamine N-deacetylase
VSRLVAALRRRASLVLLPLSVVPFVAVAPTIVDSHARFQREHQMPPLPAPVVGLTGAEIARFKPLPATPGRIPVLNWHGINEARDGYSTSRRSFARQLALLDRLGYTAISTRQWAEFRAGRTDGLPAKPILLTFDDGRLDSYRGADRILERYRMRAAMFVITGEIERRNPFYLTWAELHRMAASGRWDIEPHAHNGHGEIMTADGRRAPFYAALRQVRPHGQETLGDWEERVARDLFELRDRFAAQGIVPHAFAVPFGDYGQHQGTGRGPIPRLLSSLLTRQFGNFFVQADDNDPSFTTPGSGRAERYELRTGTTLDDLYGWLRKHSAPRHHTKSKR